MGDAAIPKNIQETWREKMKSYSKLQNAELVIMGGENKQFDKFQYVNELYEAKKQEIVTKDEQIKVLEKEIDRLSRFAYNEVPFQEISKEIKINYSNILELGFGNEIKTDFKKIDTIPMFIIKWEKGMSSEKKIEASKKLTEWLKVRMKNDKIEVKYLD